MASDTAAVAAAAAAGIEDTSLSIPPRADAPADPSAPADPDAAADAAALGQTLGTYPAVYVRGLAADVGDAELRAAFARYGAVRAAAVVRDARTGASRGYAFVRYAALASAHAAAAAPAPPPALRGAAGPPTVALADPKNVVHCRRIPAALPEDAVRAALERITRLRVYRFVLHTHPSGRSKGYGWARFADHRAALLALERLRDAPFPTTTAACSSSDGSSSNGNDDGRNEDSAASLGPPLIVSLAEPRVAGLGALEGARALFVRGIAPGATPGAVRAAFGGAAVERVFLPRAPATRAPLGTAVVHYRTRSDAARALAQMDGATVLGRRVHAEWWLPPEACRSHAAKTRLLAQQQHEQEQQQCQRALALAVAQQQQQPLCPPVVLPVLVPALPGARGRRRRSTVLVPAAPAAGALCFAPFVPCPVAPAPVPVQPPPQRRPGRRRGRGAAAAPPAPTQP